MNMQLSLTVLAYALATVLVISQGLPVLDESDIDNSTLAELRDSINDTRKNLYVVKAVVYEIGILTEADDNDTSSFESQERVDLTFYDAHTNQSHIDLGNIPLPIETNVTGQVLTGIAPVNIGAFSSPSELLATLPLTGTIVNITHSNTAFYQLTKSNASAAERPHIVNNDELKLYPEAANIFGGISAAPTPTRTTAHSKKSVLSNSLESGDD